MKALFNSFRFKLVLSLFLIVIVVLGSLYYVVNRTTQSEFRDYVVRGRSNQLRGVRETLLSYYRETGSWNGVDSVFRDKVGTRAGGNGKGPGGSANSPAGGTRNVALVGPAGRIIASYDSEMVGKKIPVDLLSQGISLELDGQKVGTLLAGPILATELDQPERQFLESVNRRIIYAGVVGLAVALLLGWLLVRQLTRPLNKLTRATKQVSRGELDYRVPVDSNDELGELAESFNRMTRDLQESKEIRRRMIGDIAHELRTPLTVLSGEVEAIREGVYEPTEEKLGEIQEDINLLNRLIEDLRELTLAEAGELELNRGPTDLSELVRRSASKLSDLVAQNDVELKTDLSEALPEIELDADRILQVINNLVPEFRYAYSRHQPSGKKAELQVVTQRRALRKKDYQILVPIANPTNASNLTRYAGMIAQARDAEILLLNMLTVPDQTPLAEAFQFVSEGEKVIERAMDVAPSNIPVHSTIRYGHDVARGIIAAVKEHNSNLLVMGWGGELKEGHLQLGEVIDPVIAQSPCDSMVIKPGEPTSGSKDESILCPVTGGPHSEYVLGLSTMMAKQMDTEVTVLHILSEDEDPERIKSEIRAKLPSSKESRININNVKVLSADRQNISKHIIDESSSHSLVMIGATREGVFDQLLFGTVPRRVAAGCDSTVIMSKKYLGIRSWVQRWLGT